MRIQVGQSWLFQVSQDVELVGNALFAEDTVELLVVAEALIVPAGGEDVCIALVAVEVPCVAEVGQVVRGQVEIDIFVVVAVEKACHVEGAGHRKQSGEHVGVAEGDVGGVESAEAAAQGDHVRIPVLLPDERKNLMQQVVFVLDVAGDAPARRDVVVVPAFHVDGIDAEELDLAGVDLAARKDSAMPRSSNS